SDCLNSLFSQSHRRGSTPSRYCRRHPKKHYPLFRFCNPQKLRFNKLKHSAMDSKPSSKLNCRHCGSSEINEDRRRGDTVCMNCGAVLEEGMIVNEVEFQDSAAGSAQVIGQFMANDSSGFLPGSASLASKLGFQRESRQLTLNNARRRLQQVGGQLRLTQHQIDMAYNFYRTILNRGWTRGRKVNYVIAACLYIVCRTEGTHHMLLDLSDLLQVNVYVLGRSYTEIAKRLCINIPALDPCLYIQRFAQKLEFGDKSREVETTAMRLLQRMKKDWIAVGRRPAGLAASALLVAGRLHNYNRTVEDVARLIAKISEQTARKRLQEFAKTPSSTLTIEEFLSVDYEGEHDPPAFLEGLKRATTDRDETDMDRMCKEVGELEALIDREMEKLQERRVRGIVSGLFVVAGTGTAASTSSAAAGQQPSTPAEPAAAEKPDVKPDAAAQFLLNCDDAEVNLSARHVLKDALEGVVDAEELECCVDDLHQAVGAGPSSQQQQEQQQPQTSSSSLTRSAGHGVDHMMAAVGIDMKPALSSLAQAPGIITKSECYTSIETKPFLAPTDDAANDGELSLEGIDDEELEREYLLSRREVLIKARDWYRRNADWLRDTEKRRAKLAAVAAAAAAAASGDPSGVGSVDVDDDVAQLAAAASATATSAPRRRTKRTAHASGIQTTEQAIEVAIRSKRSLSSKINYEALKLLSEPLVKQQPGEEAAAATADQHSALPSPVAVKPPPAGDDLPPPPPPAVSSANAPIDIDHVDAPSTLSKQASASIDVVSSAAPVPAPVSEPFQQEYSQIVEDLDDEDEYYDDDPSSNVVQLLRREGAGQYGAGADDFDDEWID
uniref:B-related factor 1 n=1 Tax=Macrostomum lignano TaxID=282301 RepID=A0A1I8GCL3_9PLAT